MNLLIRDNFIFKSAKGCLVVLFTSIVNLLFYIILIYNNLNKSVNLSSKLYINIIIDIKVNKYYYLDNSEEV